MVVRTGAVACVCGGVVGLRREPCSVVMRGLGIVLGDGPARTPPRALAVVVNADLPSTGVSRTTYLAPRAADCSLGGEVVSS